MPIELPDYDRRAALGLAAELGVSGVLAQVLVRRGFADPDDARAFLDAGETHPPAAFAGIEAALELIRAHVAAGSRITIHGDYDVDGVCATAILLRALRSLGAEADWLLPSRIDDGYGLTHTTIERLTARGTQLLITVDCAVTAVAEVAAARAAGIDVVVTDHHQPRADGRLPDAPLVHPALCGYPCAELCAGAVALKLAEALGAPTAAEDLELAAIATIADLVPLRGENRAIARAGIRALAMTAKPGLRALMAVARVDPSAVSARSVGFGLAPRLNAAGRLHRADAALELLLTDDEQRAAEIAQELDGLNAERRATEQRILWEAEAQVAALGERRAYVLAAEGWHPGVIGIVASRIAERHNRPALLVALDGERGTGSGRSIAGFDLLAALHACAGELERYGGHAAAAGVTVARERIEALRAAFEAHAEAALGDDLLERRVRADAVVAVGELGLELAEELERLEPCGLGNPRPALLLPGVALEDPRPMGENGRHLRFAVAAVGARARAVSFGCDGRLPVARATPADAVCTLERNEWNGVVEPRLVLRHAQPAAECDPIEVIGEPPAGGYVAAAIAELDVDLDALVALPAAPLAGRRCEELGPIAVLRDLVATGEPVLAVCADAGRRLPGLAERAGGFALCAYRWLERDHTLADRFEHIVALDPPIGEAQRRALSSRGQTHLSWGSAELRFAQQINEMELSLRASLVALYRALGDRRTVIGEELEQLLRGDGPHGRSAVHAGRLVRVLTELGLVSLDRDLPALHRVGAQRTTLERSSAYRAYQRRYEDGRPSPSSEAEREARAA